jgi:enoyl-CoA hydratase/carnithine racemase
MAIAHSSNLISVEWRKAGAVWVTINRPQARNALSRQVNLELRELAERLGRSHEARVVVITGAGDKAFCAGADLKERAGVTAEDTKPYVDAISAAITAWSRIPKPTIAALNGAAFGGGLELALACDFRIATTTAAFGLTEVRLGIMPGAGGTQRLPRLIGVARAKELVLLGRRISAERALEIGLINDIAEPGKLDAAVDGLIEEIAACAPLSITKAKEAIERGIELPLDQALRLERECYNVTLFSEDRNEGLRAFAEKRKPSFTGK